MQDANLAVVSARLTVLERRVRWYQRLTLALGLGLVLGAVVGMAIALIAAPYPGEETRRRLGQHVDKIKRQGEEQIEQMRANAGNGGTAYTTPTPAYERTTL